MMSMLSMMQGNEKSKFLKKATDPIKTIKPYDPLAIMLEVISLNSNELVSERQWNRLNSIHQMVKAEHVDPLVINIIVLAYSVNQNIKSKDNQSITNAYDNFIQKAMKSLYKSRVLREK